MTGLPRIFREDGTVHDPSDCAACGIAQRPHCQRWTDATGWHRWIAPTQEQRLARMLARRASREHCMSPETNKVLAATTTRTHTHNTAQEG